MHVLIVPSWYPQYPGDPSGSFFREQAIAIAKRAHRVGVIHPNFRSLRELWNLNAAQSGVMRIPDEGTLLLQCNGFNWTPRLASGYALQWLHRGPSLFNDYVKQYGRPDIIHAHCGIYAGILARKISTQTGIPYIVTEHSSGYFSNIYSRNLINQVKSVFRDASSCIAVSRSLLQLLIQKYRFTGKWQVIPNIVSEKFFVEPQKSAPTNGPIRFLNAALLNSNKRQDLLIDAFAICKANGIADIELTIAGEGPERQALLHKINTLGLADCVHMIGMIPRDKMPSIMSSHDAFVLSSNYETFGVVAAEALATGLYCISTECGGPSDIIGPGDGKIVPKDDAAALATEMSLAARADSNRFDTISRRKRANDRFGEDAVCQAVIEAYKQAIKTGK